MLKMKQTLNDFKKIKVHRIIATAFLQTDTKRTQVNHKDLNKKNNLPENLEWCTQSENIIHAYLNNAIKITQQKKVGMYSLEGFFISSMGI